MAGDSAEVLQLMGKRGMDGDGHPLRETLGVLVEGIMEAEVPPSPVPGHCGRSPDRQTHRDGCLNKNWDTQVGKMKLRTPELRDGSYFPSPREPRRRSEKALLAVSSRHTQKACRQGEWTTW